MIEPFAVVAPLPKTVAIDIEALRPAHIATGLCNLFKDLSTEQSPAIHAGPIYPTNWYRKEPPGEGWLKREEQTCVRNIQCLAELRVVVPPSAQGRG